VTVQKNSISAFAGQTAGKFVNFCFKGLAKKYSNSLFVEKAAEKYKNYDFNKCSRPLKISIALLERRRLANF
jgi:ATP-dependent protease HslVU (ClpYQ) peptidase subunit